MRTNSPLQPSRRHGVPVVATCQSACEGLRRLGAQAISVVNPPWFDEELDRLGAEYFRSQGFDVVAHGTCGLPSNQRSINPPELYDWIRAHTRDTAASSTPADPLRLRSARAQSTSQMK